MQSGNSGLEFGTATGGTSPDPTLDTGHYDDGHAFGWKAAEQPPSGDLDTGHYDDGHAFGWNTKREDEPEGDEDDAAQGTDTSDDTAPPPVEDAEATTPAASLPVPVIAAGAAIVLILAAVGFGLARSSSPSSAPTEAPVVAAPTAARAVVACTLLTTAEASTILGKTTTTDVGGSDLCNYTPTAPGADFAVPETGPRGEDLTQDIRIAMVVIRSATGAQAASNFNDSFALFDQSKGDELVPGIGDKAFYSRGGLYVLQGTKFLAITTTSQQSASFGSPVYPPMHAKFLSILEAFAALALPRLS